MLTIQTTNISKRYRIGQREEADTLAQQVKNTVLYPIKNFRRIAGMNKFSGKEDGSVFWALKDINFEVKEGEVVGIIGHNGAGKSTLLKVLSKITAPTTGEIKIRGRVSSLLEVGTGFHPELTGRDNVYMNGTILGMSKSEIDAKFDEIVEFSGIERHIDTAVKFYSSGMKVRLGFSVAAHLEPEVLIIDEVLAVGDLAFQRKCLNKMDDVSQSGRTVLFVSHNMAAVEGLCTRGILLNQGGIVFDGGTDEAIERYRDMTLSVAGKVDLAERTDRRGQGDIRFTHLTINDGGAVLPDAPIKITLGYFAKEALSDVHISIAVCRNYQDRICVLDSKSQGFPIAVGPGEGTLEVTIESLPLLPNVYTVDLWAGSGAGGQDQVASAARFTMEEADVYGSGNILREKRHGFFYAPMGNWNVLQTENR